MILGMVLPASPKMGSSDVGLRNLPPLEVSPHSDAVGPAAPLMRAWPGHEWCGCDHRLTGTGELGPGHESIPRCPIEDRLGPGMRLASTAR